ncbi:MULTISPECIES: hypothetical protein [unclassified Oceanispirochaeta]|uniref:hypothetical protein n=1 Tax=unclassified Oceanispirochaeta TaxID=2635722 RepID=UPI000E08FECC|nr:MULTISPECIES: hypothetical protein [unclassified Oceanispirochaeta]MBF9016071.1 hypothetical protein [Oceanispirochaeta sp. M2]NPD72534.1 hypothetical protein [Oceanispirochaeta sp. M1]RDG31991.1 hypothetical protein DV872_10515 [Oceanispirochaeta sp. M1]
MNKIKYTAAVLLLITGLYGISALELKDNSSKVLFDEKDAVWSLYYNYDGKMLPLFEDRDSRTSYMNIVIDNRTYRLQKNSFFNQHTESNNGYVVAHWSNNILHVTQTVKVDHQIKGFSVTVTVRNLSKNYLSVGLKNLVDTHNNSDGPDFTVNGNLPVNSEREWTAAEVPDYWATFPNSESGSQMTYTTLGDRKPDRIIFANWKRLNDSDWDFNLREGRDFSLLPYSINDSAAGIFYNAVSIPPGTEISIQYALTAGGPVLGKRSSASTAAVAGSSDTLDGKQIILNYALGYDLDLIDKIIDEINSLLKTADPVYNSQIEYYENELEKLKQKLSHYENLQ